MIKAYSQRVTPPFSGTAQVVESNRARAISMDGSSWEIHFVRGTTSNKPNDKQRAYLRVANIRHTALRGLAEAGEHDGKPIDDRILELAAFLANAELPFPPADVHEYWLLSPKDGSPLAMIFSCVDLQTRETFPAKHSDWTSLPQAVMPVERTQAELDAGKPPVNYQVESMIRERAGYRPLAKWFHRPSARIVDFPDLLLTQDWQDEQQARLCERYLQRQAPRLLMLHGLSVERRSWLEQATKAQAIEVGRFHAMYPEVVDHDLISALRVEARLRAQSGDIEAPINRRRDGVLYI